MDHSGYRHFRKLAVCLAAAAITVAPVMAGPPEMSGLDFIVDWQKYIGVGVIILDGTITAMSNDSGYLKVPGGIVILSPPWTEREDLRFLFENCTGLRNSDKCNMAIAGIVETSILGGPGLKNVDFAIPK